MVKGEDRSSKEILLGDNRKLREELKALKAELETVSRAESFLRKAWENDPGGIFLETPEGRIVDCNPAGCRMFGYSREEMLGLNASDLVPGDLASILQWTGGFGRIEGNPSADQSLLHRDGTIFPARIDAHLVEVGGEILRIAYVRNISDLKKVEEELRFQAYTDGLTGIWNRSFFQRRLLEEMERVRRYGALLSLIMFDVDSFKLFNDRHGHICGDKALKRIADLVRDSIRVSDCFSRWGGDEFLIFSPVSGEKAMAFAERLRREIKGADWPKGMEITLSLGVVEFQGDIPLETLMDRADQAMYRAKRAGGNRVCAWGSEQMWEENSREVTGFH